MPKLKARKLKLNVYKLIADAVDVGCVIAYNRAHKHTDKPDEETMHSAYYGAVMNELCEILDFDDVT